MVAQFDRLPRATATTLRANRVASATTAIAGRLRSVVSTGGSCGSTRRTSAPAARTIAATVFSCVASRKKRGGPAGARDWSYPNWLNFGSRSQRRRNEHREIAALRRGCSGPRDPKGRRSTAHSFLLGSSPPAEAQRAPTSCSPPRRVAANCATLKVAKARPILWARQQFAASGGATSSDELQSAT